MRAGRGSIGKVEVDCRFLFKKSQWGIIGESRNPAGILYLDLDLRQPPDCKLESATVTVTLEEEDGEDSQDGDVGNRSACPVKFTDQYGPRSLRGEQSLEQTRKVKKRTPEVQVMGYGAGGIGVDKEKIVRTASRWKFSGHICSSRGNIWYNRLRWELQENPLERQPTHNNTIHTAFALEHNATKFYMTVHVSGKLSRLRDRLKFRSKEEENQEIVTKIEWRDGYAARLRLDAIAQDLDPAMQLQNMSNVPLELPSAMSASFHPTTTNLPSLFPPQPSITPWSGPGLLGSVDREPLRVAGPGGYLQTPTLDDLRVAAGIATQPLCPPQTPQTPATPRQQDADEASDYSGSETLVCSSTSTTPVDESVGQLSRDAQKSDPAGQPDPQSQGVLAQCGYLVVMVLRWLGVNMGLLLLWLAGAEGGYSKAEAKLSGFSVRPRVERVECGERRRATAAGAFPAGFEDDSESEGG